MVMELARHTYHKGLYEGYRMMNAGRKFYQMQAAELTAIRLILTET